MPASLTYRLAKTLALGAAAVLAATALTAVSHYDIGQEEAPANVTVIYVGANDCAPCRIWRRDRWPQFSASPDFKRLAYREVTSAKLFDLLNDENWPEDLRRYRDALDKSAGVPLWFVVADDKIALTARGLREWGELAIPKIRSLVH